MLKYSQDWPFHAGAGKRPRLDPLPSPGSRPGDPVITPAATLQINGPIGKTARRKETIGNENSPSREKRQKQSP
jgi:hypothetical protein